MTSTAGGPDGLSFGWINRELLASGVNNPHINAFGGEDRFWLGPEGGQFSIFFKKGDPFDLDHWWTPPAVNEGSFDIAELAPDRIRFRKSMHLVNYSGTEFDVAVDREVRILGAAEVAALGDPRPRGRQDGRLRLRQQDHQHRRGRLDEGYRSAFDLDPGHVQPFSRRRRSSSRSRAARKRRLGRSSTTPISARSRPTAWWSRIRTASFSSAATASTGARSASSPGAGQAVRRELRRGERGPDHRPPDGPRGRRRLRQLDVADPGEALRWGRRQ